MKSCKHKRMKILINTPLLSLLGGVANHYVGLESYWTADVRYNQIGRRAGKLGNGMLYLPWDIIKFIYLIITFRPDWILLNPSLAKRAMLRDFVFLRIAKFFGQRVSIFIHGFNYSHIDLIGESKLSRNLNRCDSIFLLAKEFETAVRSWGVSVPIYLSTTKVDDKLIETFDIEKKTGELKSVLFLSRITEKKGIFIALDAFRIVQNKYEGIQLRVVGDGDALQSAKAYCVENRISNVIFDGALSGDMLVSAFKNSDLYLFPTTHGEGMPTSVLEAMAFGLPVLTRPVGGLVDFFTKDMGRMIDSIEAKDFADSLEEYINSPQLCKQTAAYNHSYALKHFMASSVASGLENQLK